MWKKISFNDKFVVNECNGNFLVGKSFKDEAAADRFLEQRTKEPTSARSALDFLGFNYGNEKAEMIEEIYKVKYQKPIEEKNKLKEIYERKHKND